MLGAILAYTRVRTPEPRGLFDMAAVLMLLIGLAIIWVFWKHPSALNILPESLAHGVLWVDKTTLDPLRLISVLSLFWLTVRLVPRGAEWLHSWWSAPFVLIGQHSLPVFCVGIVISFGGRLALELNDGALTQLLVNLIGAGSLLVVGALAAWFSSSSARRRRQDTTSHMTSVSLIRNRSAAAGAAPAVPDDLIALVRAFDWGQEDGDAGLRRGGERGGCD